MNANTEKALKLSEDISKKLKFLETATPRLSFEPRFREAYNAALERVRTLNNVMTMYSLRNDFGVAYVNSYLEADKAYTLMTALMPSDFKKDIEERIANAEAKSRYVAAYM